MLKRIMRSVLVFTVVIGITGAMTQSADAGRRGRIAAGVAVGTLLGLGIAGAYAGPRYYPGPAYYRGPAYYDDGPDCYRGPRQCHYVGRSCWYNRYGEYICRGGEYRCWRPRICD
jgi:hypothetical protein